MTTLGIDITTNDQEIGWADIKPTIHPINKLRSLSVSIWKLSAELEDKLDRIDICALQDIAQELDDYADQRDEIFRKQYENEIAEEREYQDQMISERP